MLTAASYVHTIHNNSITTIITGPATKPCLIISRSPPLRNITTASSSPKQINSDDDVVDEVVDEFVDGKELTEGKKEGDDDEEGTKDVMMRKKQRRMKKEREMHVSMMRP